MCLQFYIIVRHADLCECLMNAILVRHFLKIAWFRIKVKILQRKSTPRETRAYWEVSLCHRGIWQGDVSSCKSASAARWFLPVRVRHLTPHRAPGMPRAWVRVCVGPAPSRSVPSPVPFRLVPFCPVPHRVVRCGMPRGASITRVHRERGGPPRGSPRSGDAGWIINETPGATHGISFPTVGSAVSITVNQPGESLFVSCYILRSSSAKGSLHSIRLAKNFTCVYWYFSSKELK